MMNYTTSLHFKKVDDKVFIGAKEIPMPLEDFDYLDDGEIFIDVDLELDYDDQSIREAILFGVDVHDEWFKENPDDVSLAMYLCSEQYEQDREAYFMDRQRDINRGL